MATTNYHTREITLKIVYYGPGIGGKTTSLEYLHRLYEGSAGEMTSLATDEDRTLYFDYLPVELPRLGSFAIKVQFYTVPGQVYYNATRKLVLEGADGVVFVADSQRHRLPANLESLSNLCDNLAEKGFMLRQGPEAAQDTNPQKKLIEVPWVIQYNKRDMPEVMSVPELEVCLNRGGAPSFETTAINGGGVLDAAKVITEAVLTDVRNKGRSSEAQAPVTSEGSRQLPAIDQSTSGLWSLSSMTATTLSDIRDVVDQLAVKKEANTPTTSPQRPRWSKLLRSAHSKRSIDSLERFVERQDYVEAIHLGFEIFRHVSLATAENKGWGTASDITMLAALSTGMDGQRYRELMRIISLPKNGATVTETDALYVIFTVVDFLMRIESTTDEIIIPEADLNFEL